MTPCREKHICKQGPTFSSLQSIKWMPVLKKKEPKTQTDVNNIKMSLSKKIYNHTEVC